MFKKCSYCRHKIKCQLDYDGQELIKGLWESIKDMSSIESVEKSKHRAKVITITTRNVQPNDWISLSKISFQKHRGNWFCYTKQIHCIVLKCQLERIKKQGGY